MGSDEHLWVAFLSFKDDAPADVRDGFGQGGIQISSADTSGSRAAAQAYQELCRNTIPIVSPSELDECLAIAALMEAEQALAALTVQEQEPPVKKRRGPVPPPPPSSAPEPVQEQPVKKRRGPVPPPPAQAKAGKTASRL